MILELNDKSTNNGSPHAVEISNAPVGSQKYLNLSVYSDVGWLIDS